jgi:hypothetical protein
VEAGFELDGNEFHDFGVDLLHGKAATKKKA